MFDNGNAGAEQRGMDGTSSVVGRIDVERIDPDERDAGGDKLFGKFAGQMRMVFEILIGAPVRVPAGVEKKRFAAHSRRLEG